MKKLLYVFLIMLSACSFAANESEKSSPASNTITSSDTAALDKKEKDAIKLSEIRSKIEEAQSCETDDQCGVVFLGCPFGCGTPINASNIQEIRVVVAEYGHRCNYGCRGIPTKSWCINKKCSFK